MISDDNDDSDAAGMVQTHSCIPRIAFWIVKEIVGCPIGDVVERSQPHPKANGAASAASSAFEAENHEK